MCKERQNDAVDGPFSQIFVIFDEQLNICSVGLVINLFFYFEVSVGGCFNIMDINDI